MGRARARCGTTLRRLARRAALRRVANRPCLVTANHLALPALCVRSARALGRVTTSAMPPRGRYGGAASPGAPSSPVAGASPATSGGSVLSGVPRRSSWGTVALAEAAAAATAVSSASKTARKARGGDGRKCEQPR